MSLNGKAESVIKLRGSLSMPDAIVGKSAYEVAVMNGFKGTEAEWLASLKYTNLTDDEKAEVIADVMGSPEIAEMQETAERAETIAKGRCTGYVFDTYSALTAWLASAENKAKLLLGDNLYIRATDTPDYWWDGTQIQRLETQKVDLTEYYTKDEVNALIDEKIAALGEQGGGDTGGDTSNPHPKVTITFPQSSYADDGYYEGCMIGNDALLMVFCEEGYVPDNNEVQATLYNESGAVGTTTLTIDEYTRDASFDFEGFENEYISASGNTYHVVCTYSIGGVTYTDITQSAFYP